MNHLTSFNLKRFTPLSIILIAAVLFVFVDNLQADNSWQATYWNNTNLSGAPVLTRTESNLNHDWAGDAPANGVNPDNFSARWEQSGYLPAGTYRFAATMDDGMRVYVDNVLIIDAWTESPVREISVERALTAGNHTIKVEYYELGGKAVAKLAWEAIGGTAPHPQPQPPASSGAWHGEYFNNTYLGGTPAHVAYVPAIDFDWGFNSPGAGVNADAFSVRWSANPSYTAGRYRFTVKGDDGVRLYVNNVLLIDSWYIHNAQTRSAEIDLPAGNIPVKLEYFENSGLAEVHLGWTAVSHQPPSNPQPHPSSDKAAHVTAAHLNMRSGPGVAYGIVTTIHRNQAVELAGHRNEDATWVDIVTPSGARGWVNVRYINSSYPLANLEAVHSPPVATVTASYLNVRYGPSPEFGLFATVYRNQQVLLAGRRNSDATWVKIVLPSGAEGWVNARYLVSTTPFNELPVGN